MKLTLENGRVSFNLVDMITELDEDEVEEVVSFFAWQDPIWHEIKRLVRSSYARNNYNPRIHELRLEFLRSDYVKKNIQRVVIDLLDQIARLENEGRDMRKALWGWEGWYRERYTYDNYPVEYDRTELVFLKDSHALEYLESQGVLTEDIEYPEKEDD